MLVDAEQAPRWALLTCKISHDILPPWSPQITVFYFLSAVIVTIEEEAINRRSYQSSFRVVWKVSKVSRTVLGTQLRLGKRCFLSPSLAKGLGPPPFLLECRGRKRCTWKTCSKHLMAERMKKQNDKQIKTIHEYNKSPVVEFHCSNRFMGERPLDTDLSLEPSYQNMQVTGSGPYGRMALPWELGSVNSRSFDVIPWISWEQQLTMHVRWRVTQILQLTCLLEVMHELQALARHPHHCGSGDCKPQLPHLWPRLARFFRVSEFPTGRAW